MTMPLRVGVMGTGFMAQMHAKNLQSQDGVEVVGVCSRQITKAEAFIAEHRLASAKPFDNFTTMLSAQGLDAVCIAIPPAAHHGEVVTALESGLHVFAEKPLALNLADAQAMANAAEKAGVVTQVCYQLRFKPSVQRLAAAIAAGSAGQPTLFTGRFWVNMEGGAWWRDAEQSGGQVFEQLIHLYNLAKALLGKPETAAGQWANLLHTQQDDYRIEDTSAGTVRFANGALASITGSNCAVPQHFFADFRIACEHVTLDYHSTGQHWVSPDHATWYQNQTSERIAEDTDAHRDAAADFIQAIRDQRPALCPIAEACDDLRLVSTVIASARQGGTPLPVVEA